MIMGYFHQGSGLGNQLHRLVATRVKAADLNTEWAMVYNPDGSGKESGFKGKLFMDIGDWDLNEKSKILYFNVQDGQRPDIQFDMWTEKAVRDDISGVDIRSYDPEFNFVENNTLIDGEFQDERYWEHREKDVDKWLKVEPLDIPDDLCVIGFRGGEFALYPDLFLEKEYYDKAIDMMLSINPDMRFEVHTDDPDLASQLFDYPVIHDIGRNWRSMRYAKHAIVANSSFFILPRWLRKGVTIAPRYWGRRNVKIWSLPQNYYKRFDYI